MPLPRPATINLRPATTADIPAMFQMQLDPEGNRLAGTKPRNLAAFTAIWEKILGLPPATVPDRAVTARVIIADGELVGTINIFQKEGADFIGYWLAREHWGRGIATRAVGLLIQEYPKRTVQAHVAAHNTASLRALERNGFAIVSREHSPETDRYTAAEVVSLVLSKG